MRHLCQCLPNVGQVQNPAEGVEEAPLPNAPVPESESSPAKVSVTSSQSAISVDLLADCKSESSASEWDYEERPLTQMSFKQGLDEAREQHRNAAWAACPTPANAPISQNLH